MFKKTEIRTKIIIAFATIAVLGIGLSGLIAYINGRNALEEESYNKLIAIREMKANQIEKFFEQISNQVVTLSEDYMVINAMKAMDDGIHSIENELNLTPAKIEEYDKKAMNYYQNEFRDLSTRLSAGDFLLENNEMKVLQDLYIYSNPNEVGEKHNLNNAGDGSSYSSAHEIYHPIFRNYIEKFGFYDMFLVDVGTGGHVAYSVFKEVDFGTSLIDGPFRNTNFAAAYQEAVDSTNKDFVSLVDFESYEPSHGESASFIASPIYDGGEKIGVLIFQMPINTINEIMTNDYDWGSVGLGKSGETYIVGEDFKLRNQSRFLIEDSENYLKMISKIGMPDSTIDKIRYLNSTIGLQEVKTQGTESALRGMTGTGKFLDYREVSVLSAYKPLEIEQLNWVIMSEIDELEAFSYIYDLKNKILIGALGILFIIGILAVFFARSFTRPIQMLTASSSELAKGNLNAKIDLKGNDEIAELAKGFDLMRKSIKALIEELEAANKSLEVKVAERTAELEIASIRFRSIVENASDAIITIDSEQNIILFNPAGEQIFGYTTAEILGKPLTILMPEKSAAKHPSEIQKFEKEKTKSRSMDSRTPINAIRKNGEIFPGEAGISKMEIKGIKYYTAFFRDITKRRELETQIQDHLNTIKKQRDRMQIELNFAREIQMDMLPLIFPAFPKREELDVYAMLTPAREVGGDFYDFFFIDTDHICLVIGDVSGKGAPGALLMAVTKTLIKSRASDDHLSSSIITHINNELSRDNKSAMFVTVFICILDVRTGEISYTNAGHNPPYIKRNNGVIESLNSFHGPVIGAMSGFAYGNGHVSLNKDDILVLYTDGVTEAMNESEKLFTEDRLTKLLDESTMSTAETLLEEVFSEVIAFQGEAEQADDITILAIRYKGGKEFYERKITISNEMSNLEVVENEFYDFSMEHNIPDSTRQKVSIVLDDLLNNIVSYAYKDKEEHEIVINIELSGDRLVVILIDDGIPFNPFSIPNPEVHLSIEERSVGGLGIFITRNVMDEFLYERRANKNVITLVKMIEGR